MGAKRWSATIKYLVLRFEIQVRWNRISGKSRKYELEHEVHESVVEVPNFYYGEATV